MQAIAMLVKKKTRIRNVQGNGKYVSHCFVLYCRPLHLVWAHYILIIIEDLMS